MYLHNVGKLKKKSRNYAGVGDIAPEDQFQPPMNEKNQELLNYQKMLRKTP